MAFFIQRVTVNKGSRNVEGCLAVLGYALDDLSVRSVQNIFENFIVVFVVFFKLWQKANDLNTILDIG